jgi:acyl-coenzyme A synthetase/AMP-(fatty) acid ligase
VVEQIACGIVDYRAIHAAEAEAKLPRYKRPEQIYFGEELPRTVTGKVQRFKLRERSSSYGAS